MNIYKIYQNVNRDYDTFDSAVVYAENEDETCLIHPDEFAADDWYIQNTDLGTWTTPDNVRVQFLGVADDVKEKGIILASFNAG